MRPRRPVAATVDRPRAGANAGQPAAGCHRSATALRSAGSAGRARGGLLDALQGALRDPHRGARQAHRPARRPMLLPAISYGEQRGERRARRARGAGIHARRSRSGRWQPTAPRAPRDQPAPAAAPATDHRGRERRARPRPWPCARGPAARAPRDRNRSGEDHDARFPVIRTGRELARYFEEETPGLAHRLALTQLLSQQMWSPPRQALAWAALDITIYSALLAAWHYKWAAHIGGPSVPAARGCPFGRGRSRRTTG